MKLVRRIISVSVLLFITLSFISSFFLLPSSADGTPVPPNVDGCRAACLYDKTHDRIIVMENADTPLNTSTSAKVMMGLLACEMLGERLGEHITVTEDMLSGAGGYSMGLKPGENVKIEDILYGAICGSYNDAGYVLACVCSGTSDAFVSKMNERAHELGAKSTVYANPLGYPDNTSMLTTVSDTLKIAVAASENELYMEICSVKKYEMGATDMSVSRTVYNRNHLLTTRVTNAYYNPVCSGMNAGISGEAGGWSVITLARDEGAEYICIILGGEESADGSEIYAYDNANSLINWACDTYNLHKVFEKDQVLGKAEISLTALGKEKIDYAAAEDLSIYIPDISSPKITYKTEYIEKELKAPIKAGEKIGSASVFCNGEKVGECDIVLTEDCEANTVMKVINAIGGYTKSRAFTATIICFVILLPIALIVYKQRSYHHGHTRRY